MIDISKKDQLINAIKNQDWKKALSIAKNFRREFNEVDQSVIQIANETYNNLKRKTYYVSLGLDVNKNHELAIQILKNYK